MIKVYQLNALQNNFYVSIPFKGCQVQVKFEKGNVSKGIYARLYTNDKFVQRAVEASEMYGKMFRLVETVAEPGDELEKTKKKVSKPAPAATQQPESPAQEPEPAPAPDPAPSTDGAEKKEFANLAEAITFIATNYQQQVTTEGEARNVLKEHGILPVIKRG